MVWWNEVILYDRLKFDELMKCSRLKDRVGFFLSRFLILVVLVCLCIRLMSWMIVVCEGWMVVVLISEG